MELKDEYSFDEIADLLDELLDLGIDFNELPEEMELIELVKMSNRLRS